MQTTGSRGVAGTALLIALAFVARAYGEPVSAVALATPATLTTAPVATPAALNAVPSVVPASLGTPTSAMLVAPTTAGTDDATVDVRQWQFKYRGRGVKAEGIVTTLAAPLPDGTFQIIGVEGKRNRSEILSLEPPGELVTARGHLFSDNRLVYMSPYLNQSGFSFHIKRGHYFNVCYSGPYEGCGDDGYQGYQEYDYRSVPRPVDFSLVPLPNVMKISLAQVNPELLAPPEPTPETEPCEAEPQNQSLLSSALSMLGFGSTMKASTSNDSTCQPATLSIKPP